MPSHQAAILPGVGEHLQVQTLTTPEPGPKEVLISVSAIALNPVDTYMRSNGFRIKGFPAVLGTDISGVIESVGSAVDPASPLVPGARVLAFAVMFLEGAVPRFGAYQKKVIVPVWAVCPIPDGISHVDASTLSMSILTAWSGLTSIGFPLSESPLYTASDKQGILVWGASGSVGASTVQVAKELGFVVYAAAGPQNHAYLKSLGAKEVFDYKSPTVAKDILAAAKSDGVTLDVGYRATGDIQPIFDVLSEASTPEKRARLATAIPLFPGTPTNAAVDTKFVSPPMEDLDAQAKHYAFVFHTWLPGKLASGEIVPAPKARVIPGGLEALDGALDILQGGVSSEKLVVEI